MEDDKDTNNELSTKFIQKVPIPKAVAESGVAIRMSNSDAQKLRHDIAGTIGIEEQELSAILARAYFRSVSKQPTTSKYRGGRA